jgi:hypothetical protein
MHYLGHSMKAHVVENGVITNTIEVDSLDAMPGLIAADTGTIGDSVVDGVIVPAPAPPVPVPESVTMRQARLALHAAGLLSGVDAAIASMQEPAKTAAAIEWEYASAVERNAGLVPAMAAALGMSEADIDDLFITAATL